MCNRAAARGTSVTSTVNLICHKITVFVCFICCCLGNNYERTELLLYYSTSICTIFQYGSLSPQQPDKTVIQLKQFSGYK